jgi:hypothetical protein
VSVPGSAVDGSDKGEARINLAAIKGGPTESKKQGKGWSTARTKRRSFAALRMTNGEGCACVKTKICMAGGH